jgi:2-polyprenyl-6-methoxyphenol hydroxylase-like FAD-dependent oxidoreductase
MYMGMDGGSEDTMKSIFEPLREIPVIAEVDVVVAGAGPAGFAAAVAAARLGASTMLVERHGFLGGMMTAGLVLTLGGYNCWIEPYERVVAGIGGELLSRAAAQDGAEDNDSWVLNSEPEIVKLVCDEMVEEARVRTLLHSYIAAPYTEGATVRGIIVENKSGRGAILARVVVDATGDADLAVRAGAGCTKSPSLQPMTLGFILGHVHGATPAEVAQRQVTGHTTAGEMGGTLKISRREDVRPNLAQMQRAREAGEIPTYGGPWFGGLRADRVWVNSTRLLGDASDAESLTQAEMQGRRDAWALWRYLQRHVPALAKSEILASGPQIGIRETRQIVGDYLLTGDDVRSGARFPDGVCLGAWPIDVHPADGAVGVHGCYVPWPYQIPYRALLPRGLEGLLVAGRCISADQEAMGSLRVVGTCMAIGQAAGTAAGLSASQGIVPRALNPAALRSALLEQGAKLEPVAGRKR